MADRRGVPVDTDRDDGASADCVIVHVDMDAFFAAIEVLDDPSLRGRPVVVGGTGPRGVVASCTYEARAFGVRSAMPAGEARRRCPHAVFVHPRHDRYAEVSARMHTVLRAVTPVVEPIGLDEAFLDVAGARRRLGPPERIARRLVDDVRDQLGLTCAAGVARTKSLAKLASRRAKAVPPDRRLGDDGVVVVPPAAEAAFLHPLPVGELWGVGPATAARLAAVGITTVGELADVPEPVLARLVGHAAGAHLAALAGRRADDPVVADRPVKSIGREVTLAVDLRDPAAVVPVVADLAGAVGDRLASGGLVGRTVTVKVRFADRRTITRSATVGRGVGGPQQVLAVARHLLDQVDVGRGIRLVGVAVSGLGPRLGAAEQLSLLGPGQGSTAPGPGSTAPVPPPPAARAAPGRSDQGAAEDDVERWRQVDRALTAVRQRFGRAAVVPGIAVPPGPGGRR